MFNLQYTHMWRPSQDDNQNMQKLLRKLSGVVNRAIKP